MSTNKYQEYLNNFAGEIAADINPDEIYQVNAVHGSVGINVPDLNNPTTSSTQDMPVIPSNIVLEVGKAITPHVVNIEEEVLSEIVAAANQENTLPVKRTVPIAGKPAMLRPDERAKIEKSLRRKRKVDVVPLADATNKGPKIKSVEVLQAPHPITIKHHIDQPSSSSPAIVEDNSNAVSNSQQNQVIITPPADAPLVTVLFVPKKEPSINSIEGPNLGAVQHNSINQNTPVTSTPIQENLPATSLNIYNNQCNSNQVIISKTVFKQLVPGIVSHSKKTFVSVMKSLIHIPPPTD